MKGCSAPADISEKSVSGTCDQKCDYHFQYAKDIVTAKNKGMYVDLSCSTTAPSVHYNAQTFTFTGARVYCPSLHTYDKLPADAECVLEHRGTDDGTLLLVCVPIAATTTGAATIFDRVATALGKRGPTLGGSATVDGAVEWSTLIPTGTPFYSYAGSMPWFPCASRDGVDYVVFRKGVVGMSAASLATFRKLLLRHNAHVVDGIKLFRNDKGAHGDSGGGGDDGGDDVYIDCQPVDDGDDGTFVIDDGPKTQQQRGSKSAGAASWAVPLTVTLLFLLVLVGIRHGNGLWVAAAAAARRSRAAAATAAAAARGRVVAVTGRNRTESDDDNGRL